MTLSTNEMLDLPWKLFSRDDRKIVDCHGNTIIAEPDDNDLPDFVDLYAAQAALIVRAVNAHELLYRFMSDMCEHADTATREYALSIAAKLGEGDG